MDLEQKFQPKNDTERRLLGEHLENQDRNQKAASLLKNAYIDKAIEEAERGLYKGMDREESVRTRGAIFSFPANKYPGLTSRKGK